MADSSHSPTAFVILLFVAFALYSVAFWAYFRFRDERVQAEDEPAWIEVG